MELNVRETGNPAGPAIALLHGFMSCNAQWLLNEAALGQHYRLLQIELWGHGDSPLPEADAFTIDGYIEQFEAIRTRHGIDRWFAIGQSYGAGLMLSYACAYPEVVRAVVTTNSRSAFGIPGTLPQRVERSAKRAQSPGGAEGATRTEGLRKLPFHPIHARRFPAAVQQALVASADRMSIEAIRHSGELGEGLNFHERLHQVPVPVMIANGQFEKSFQRDLEALSARYDQLAIANLEGGHSINIETPAAFDGAVLAFLEAVMRGEHTPPTVRS